MSLENWDCSLAISDEANGTYTTLAEITDVSGIGITGEANEDGVLGQKWASFSGGKLTGDAFTLTLNWNPTEATHATLFGLMTTQAKKYWKFTIQGGHSYVQRGHVTGFKPGSFTQSGRVTAAVTIQPSGAPTLTVVGA